MKILAIRGKNLASLEGGFEIDFATEPLRSAGIFAITGSTGSGKSTLLDALCLALFDNTPRVSHAGENNVFIPDVGDKTIHQKDSRNLLRRGTSDAYAEVDFVSLGGEKYRSTWSVKRARNRVEGSLQSSELRLLNISSGTEAQGRKTELLAKIVELIGLTFDQFTRAVLLAQGDFAAFLKAKQSEKAELLEKLTGTDIYSRISMAIYEKSKRNEQEYQALKERVQDIELLTDEQIEIFISEKEAIGKEQLELKTIIGVLTEKIKWIENDRILREAVAGAEKLLADAQSAIALAQPRFDFIAQIESVQEIRDPFNELQNTKKQLEGLNVNLKKQENEYQNNSKLLSQAVEAHVTWEKEQTELDKQIETIEPEAIKARALDVQINGTKTNVEEAGIELEKARLSKERIEKNTQVLAKDIEKAKELIQKFAQWFSQHNAYKGIIPKIDLIISLLDDARATKEQGVLNLNLQHKNRGILEDEQKKLTAFKEKLEHLSNLLPSEIAALRTKLKDGDPCPVCGSLHHPVQEIKEDQKLKLKEEELTKAKQSISDEILLLTESIDKRKTEMTRLTALIENYAKQSEDAMAKAGNYLSVLTFSKDEWEQGILQTKLKDIAVQWNKNNENNAKAEGVITSKSALLLSEQNNLAEAKNNVDLKTKKQSELAEILENLQKERAKLLGGKPADEVARTFAAKRKEWAEKLKRSEETKNDFVKKQETLKGIISQINNESARLSERNFSLQNTVNDWIEEKKGEISEERLSELLLKDNHWLDAEKQFLNSLKERETSAKTRLSERKDNYAKHNNSLTKPQNEEETEAFLSKQLDGENLQIEQKTKRIAEIDVALANHVKGKERVKAFEKELAEKRISSENWKKLNELLGSANGSKFKEIAQGYTLDALLAYANKHLKELSRRYELQRIPETLALQVTDLDMLGEVRTVHSLSGGESFLISLALALGLSSLSSSKMRVESLFIDEGFGSLDIDTLRIAMDALERLQTEGRKIGVISHVAEMTERIATQIRVVKTINGKSKIEII